MRLGEHQRLFTAHLAHLILWANSRPGAYVVQDEAARSKEQQRLYLERGRTTTMDSQHCKRLAADLLLFMDGEYQTDTPSYAWLGEYWEALDPANRWGGRWGWDGNHFEREDS